MALGTAKHTTQRKKYISVVTSGFEGADYQSGSLIGPVWVRRTKSIKSTVRATFSFAQTAEDPSGHRASAERTGYYLKQRKQTLSAL